MVNSVCARDTTEGDGSLYLLDTTLYPVRTLTMTQLADDARRRWRCLACHVACTDMPRATKGVAAAGAVSLQSI